MIDVGTVRGVKLVACLPDLKYAHYHEIFVSPEETRIGEAVKVSTPARYAPDGRLLACASERWERGADKYVDPVVRIGTWKAGRWAEDGATGIFAALLGGVILASADAEVAALLERVAAMNAAWRAANVKNLERRAETDRLVAAAVASDGLPVRPSETECLECGATYSEPGHVEAGAMGCERCS